MSTKTVLKAGVQLSIITLICFLSAVHAHGADLYWIGGSDSWNNGANWSLTAGGPGGAGQPQSGDNAYIVTSDGINRDIFYSNTAYPDAVLNSLTITPSSGTATLWLSSGTLSAASERVAYLGPDWNSTGAVISQSGGSNIVEGTLSVGSGMAMGGTYDLSDTGYLRADSLLVGRSPGRGTFNQSGGFAHFNTLTMGGGGGVGTYNLSGGELDVGGDERLCWGTGGGTINQSGGTHTIWGTLVMTGGGVTDYNLSGTGLLRAQNVNVGTGDGAATFTHSGGTLVVEGTLTLGEARFMTGVGNYYLSNSGTLQAWNEAIRAAIFRQSGGTNTVAGTLAIGAVGGSESGYNLSGGNLNSGNTTLGSRATFDHSGGTHTISGALTIAKSPFGNDTAHFFDGIYNLSAGTLNAPIIVNNGQVNYSGGTLNANIQNTNSVNLSGAGTRTVNGYVTNSGGGTFDVSGTTGSVTGVFVNDGTITSSSAALHFQDMLTVNTAGTIQAAAGDSYFIHRDFINNSTQNLSWSTADAFLNFAGAGSHQFALAGTDMGASMDGFSNNFAWQSLTIEGTLTLTGANGAITGADYFEEIIGAIISGGTVSNIFSHDGLNVYYLASAEGNGYLNGGTYDLIGGGALIPVGSVPLPGAIFLVVPGLVGLAVFRRRLEG